MGLNVPFQVKVSFSPTEDDTGTNKLREVYSSKHIFAIATKHFQCQEQRNRSHTLLLILLTEKVIKFGLTILSFLNFRGHEYWNLTEEKTIPSCTETSEATIDPFLTIVPYYQYTPLQTHDFPKYLNKLHTEFIKSTFGLGDYNKTVFIELRRE